ncbi:bifunctional UDP-N-acetylglucosamine diphosphorylase/glucosamine-1-phosphate N-acetyltransferase GlmU [Stagnihabitans tardus]|uniref:Bifunctional protein GlmU n=1 Tax=Stagnihabitans tardus TaxID=2699202 RepID=A0AAE4Y8K6_9RHOB|nr:bifunctional UDP-N-acetylglucosamine diphosphorylase/glucosamine-1-phosphate N-acetyltransferase GlmU [Stagnihabitans tardus]NBZ87976.1 bifunctional UDP-N-acetylglucosamine diphosphorylase/glucosamine-1-phosphate N-acetyltransferase GlmU [Stagnihabitans tardus]
MQVSLIVLAAGLGSRMNSDLPKVLHNLAAVPLLHHALAAGQALSPARTVVVTGYGAEQVAKAAHDFDPDIVTALQDPPQGTAHAVAVTEPLLSDATGAALVLYGDTPFVRPETLEAMLAARSHHDIVFLGFEAADPKGYGRFIVEGTDLRAIVEEKQATDAQRQIRLCNSGVIAAEVQTLLRLAKSVPLRENVSEYYVTDIIDLARSEGLTVGYVTCPEAETLGINTRAQLAAAEAAFQTRKRAEMMEEGVTLISPETTFFARDTYIGRDAVVGPAVIFGPGVTVETGAEIKGFCHLEGCHISRGATVGPFARLRPGAELAEDVHVGNFVEIKNAVLDEGVKVGHLTYLGDAHVGEFTNIGAGTVTCNYDGVMKHRTTIGKNAFIGSDTMLVAPVTVGDNALTASGSVITEDVPEGALALARAKQVNKPGLAVRLMDKLRAIKAAKKGS